MELLGSPTLCNRKSKLKELHKAYTGLGPASESLWFKEQALSIILFSSEISFTLSLEI